MKSETCTITRTHTHTREHTHNVQEGNSVVRIFLYFPFIALAHRARIYFRVVSLIFFLNVSISRTLALSLSSS